MKLPPRKSREWLSLLREIRSGPLDEPALAEEALPKSLHVEVVWLEDGDITKCQCRFCYAVKLALADARKIGRETKLVLTFVPGEARTPEQ